MADTIAQVVVSPLLQVVYEKLCSPIQTEFGLVWGVHEEMEKLSSTLTTIQSVLNHAEEQQLTNKVIGNWLSKLKDAAYDADDVLDECAFEGLELASEMEHRSCIKQSTDSFLYCLNFKQNVRRKMGKRIKQLRGKLDEIASEKSKFDLRIGEVVERRVELFGDRETSSILKEPQVYGRDEDVMNFVTLIQNNAEGISIYPVVGIGGLGKTTFAQLVYSHEQLLDFDFKMWVFVSEDFDVRRLTKAILLCLSENVGEHDELNVLQLRLQEKLKGKRFFLVLDDVWNAELDKWNKLMCSMRFGGEGSSVIVTTRLEAVADIIRQTVPTYHLGALSEDDCWSLFKQHAFGPGNEATPMLEEIGKAIVKKCGGVPLATKALGGLLRFNSDEKGWLSVSQSEIWDLTDENQILPALRLSYNNLPAYLKQCFTYCSIFPKHHLIQGEELIHLWIANGLLQPQEGMDLEAAGNGTINKLVWRSLFQNVARDEDGNVKTCKMHSLIHDLACHVAMDECTVMKEEMITKKTRHLSVLFSTDESSSKLGHLAHSSPWLRSLISLNDWPHKDTPQTIFSSLESIRALNMRYAEITKLPKSIGKLKHLRYLNLSNTPLISLPEYICGLRNVQILKLKGCDRLQSLPKDMRKMCNLRHLDIHGCKKLTETPIGMGQLTSLRTLSIFIVGLENGRGIKELQALNLVGELEIKGIEHVKRLSEASEGNLMGKKDLRCLHLTWNGSHSSQNSSEVMEGLQPHSSLIRLFIKQYNGVTFPNWLTVSLLPNLVEISFFQCKKCDLFPPLEKLLHLKVLRIHSMDSLKFMSHGQSSIEGFMSLEELSLSMMPSLEGWSPTPINYPALGSELSDFEIIQTLRAQQGILFPCLRKLILEECPKLTRVTLSPSLKHIELRKCSEMVLGSLQNLPCLASLKIQDFEEVISFPHGTLANLPALETFQVRSCHKLVSLPEEVTNLFYLESVGIYNCYDLKCLPKLKMPYLEDLQIYDCPELEFSMEDFQGLAFLRTLSLSLLTKLMSLPNGLEHALNLQKLSILGCSNLMELPDWIGSLVSLQALCIEGSKNLKVLPDGLQHLSDLQKLEIEGCDSELEKQYAAEQGKEWYKIAHVPHVVIKS